MPSSISPYQMDIYCHAGDSYSARIINSSIITSDSEWRGRMNAHSKGKSEIVIYAISTIDTDYLENKVLILSTAGNDNVSRIYVDDSQFHVVGYTEGDIADPTVTSFSNKLFFAGFSTFDIVSVYSPGAVGNSFPFEILPGRDLAIRFSSLPANRMATFVPVITIMDVPCTNVRWIGEELFALAPPVLGLSKRVSLVLIRSPC
ncbi:hypothetical protein BKA69DRAFT_764173 [Paraphysoderma sedebokerense]|nr:hypothetical protein BKA69DRAFT_764173 [Paraphysoderma sedebokerense]